MHVMESGKILRGYVNSAIITVPVTLVSVLLGAVAGNRDHSEEMTV